MQVQLSTDSNIAGDNDLRTDIEAEVEKSLSRFDEWVTRLEVHLSDVNSSAKGGGDDKRCVIEARPAQRQPINVSHDGASVEQAYKGAIKKMLRVLDDTFSKMHHAKGRTSMGGDQTI
jgi:hypothetical protein